MPLYVYLCKDCNKLFELIVKLADSDKPIKCKYCENEMQKIMTPVSFKVN